MSKQLHGFTLVETLAAISLLSVAIVAPMTLASRSLAASYYAKDQVTAYYLAQEAIEGVRNIRDGNILQIVQNSGGSTPPDIFQYIPINQDFIINVLLAPNAATTVCSGTCPVLQKDSLGNFYGYGFVGGTNSIFTRTIRATTVGNNDQINVKVTVSWKTGSFATRSFSISENMYRWVQDGS